MQRRRKKNRTIAAKKHASPNVKLDKSLPSLPPEEADSMLQAADDVDIDGYGESTIEVGSRKAVPALDAGKSSTTADNQGKHVQMIRCWRVN